MHDDCVTDCDQAPCCRQCEWCGVCESTCVLAIRLECEAGA